jgi:histidinol-phosphate aminotransferase
VVVVITGSTRGIGRAAARALAAGGARVVVNGRARAAVDAAVAALRAGGHDAIGVAADVASPDGARALVDGAVAAFGGVDVLINNAAIGDGDFASVLAIDLAGAFHVASAFLRARPSGGRIVNISSGAAERPVAGAAAYAAAKAGLDALTRALAVDAPDTVVTGVRLGPHRTMLARPHFERDRFEELPPPEEATAAICFAATGPSAHLHGRTLAAWRLGEEPLVEARLNQPLVGLAPLALCDGDRRRAGMVALDRADNPCGVAPSVRTAIARLAETPWLHDYPDPEQNALRTALAAHLGVPRESLSLGAGATELIERVITLFVQPHERAVACAPTWSYFERLCAARGVAQRRVPFVLDERAHAARFDVDAIARALDGTTRLVYLVSPSNPVGTALAGDELARLLARAPPQVTVVVDEAYVEFSDDERGALAEVARGDERVVVVRTLSKFYALAGLRVGYAVAAPETARLLARGERPFAVGSVAAAAAIAALGDHGHAARTFANNRRERARLTALLDERGVGWLASQACFVLVAAPELPAIAARDEVLLPRERFFEGRYVMVPIGLPEQNDRVMDLLAR